MAKDRAPAFQFYPKDFLSDRHVARMTAEEIGAYWMLVCYCWLDKDLHLPSDHGELMALARLTPKRFAVAWPVIAKCFQEIPEGFTHRRLIKERAKQKEYSKGQRDNGLRGAQARWQAHRPAISGNGKPMAIHGSSSSSSSSSSTPEIKSVEHIRENPNAETLAEMRALREKLGPPRIRF